MTFGRSLGPMKIKARIATTASSEESTPNMAGFYCLAGFIVSRRRRNRLIAPRSHVDRLSRTRLVPGDLARRLVSALLVIAPTALVLIVGHPLLEALEAFGDVAHHRREAVP